MTDTPTICCSQYTNTTLKGGELSDGGLREPYKNPHEDLKFHKPLPDEIARIFNLNQITEETMPQSTNKRIVRVFIADPDPKVTVEKSLLYTGEEKLTDLTDQELFFEIENVKALLDSHNNEVRIKTEDKLASDKAGRQIFLEPIKIRDLKMTVVTIAAF